MASITNIYEVLTRSSSYKITASCPIIFTKFYYKVGSVKSIWYVKRFDSIGKYINLIEPHEQ